MHLSSYYDSEGGMDRWRDGFDGSVEGMKVRRKDWREGGMEEGRKCLREQCWNSKVLLRFISIHKDLQKIKLGTS